MIGCSAGCVKVGSELEEGGRGSSMPTTERPNQRQESKRFRRRKGRTILSNTPSVVATAKEEGLSLRISSRHRSLERWEREAKCVFFFVFF